jgi:hypothetical protein
MQRDTDSDADLERITKMQPKASSNANRKASAKQIENKFILFQLNEL